MPRLRIKNGPHRGETAQIKDESVALGRDPSCGLQILDKGASRRHAEVFRVGEMCFIRDLDSRNGTFVNDSRVDEELLREGDRIQIGATTIVFEAVAEEEGEKVEFSNDVEEAFGQTLALRLEDLSPAHVPSGEGDEAHAQRLRSLYRLSQLLAEERNQDALVNKVLEFCAKQMGADASYLFVPDPEKGNIVPLGTYHKGEAKGAKVSRSIIRRALQERRALLTSDAMKDSRFSARESIVMKQIHSVICAPLSTTEGGLGGVLYVAGESPQQTLSEDDLELGAAMAQLIGLALENLRRERDQRDTLVGTIRTLVRASEIRDPTTRGHCERIATYATGIATQMRLPDTERNDIQLAALLHDIGRVAEDEGGLTATGADTTGMTAEQKRVAATMDIIKDMTCSAQVKDAIRHQYERYDGSGPEGLQGDAIPLGARILAVARDFDARVNRVSEKRPEELIRDAIVHIGKLGGGAFDPDVVKALLMAHRGGVLYQHRPPGTGEDMVIDPRQGGVKNIAKGRL